MDPRLVVIVLGMPAKRHATGVFRPLDLPRVAIAQPVVGVLDLIAILDVLAEHAVLVMNAIAHHRQVQRGAAVHEARGEPTQTAVSQAGVGFFFGEVFQRLAKTVQGLARLVVQPQIEHMVGQRTPDQEFQRQVIGATLARLVARNIGVHPVRHEMVTQRPRQRLIGVERRTAQQTPQVIKLVTLKIADERPVTGRQRFQDGGTGGGYFVGRHRGSG